MARVTLRQLSVVQLQRELARRQSALPRLQKKRRKLAAVLEKVDGAIAELGGTVAKRAPARRGRRPRRVKRVKNAQPLGVLLAKVLQGAKSMKIGEMVEAVQRLGYKSKAKNFRLIVNQVLVKDKRFRSVRRGRYALSKAAKAPAKKSRMKKSVAKKAPAAPATA